MNSSNKKTVIVILLVVVIVMSLLSIYGSLLEFDYDKTISNFDKENSFTVVVLPDTQFYSAKYENIFCEQTEWIVENKQKLNIAFVAHVGDIVNDGAFFDKEWKTASKCLGRLEGVVPYSVVPGNHDSDKPSEKSSGFSAYDANFPASRFSGYSWYKEGFEGNRNSYQIVEAGGMKLLFLSLEIEPSDAALAWGKKILKENRDSYAVLVTHKYLSTEASSPEDVLSFSDDGNTGKGIWDKLIYPNCNVKMVLSGHFHGENRISSENSCSEPVHQITQDYQDYRNGGDGWLRIYVFTPFQRRIDVYTYSPFLKKWKNGNESMFTVGL